MLGKVVQQQIAPKKEIVSTWMRDQVLEKWKDGRENLLATLEEQDETWKEFWLYASETDAWCPRMCALKSFFVLDKKIFKAETLWNFGQGNAYHELFQKNIWPKTFGKNFLGSWERYVIQDDKLSYRKEETDSVHWLNSDVGSEFLFDHEDADKMMVVNPWQSCPEGDGWRYVESKVRVDGYRIVVKLDGILRKDTVLETQELKTEKGAARDILDPCIGGSPRKKHIEQVNLGMWVTGIKNNRLSYIFKDALGFGTSLLEHEISYDEEIIENLKQRAENCVKVVKQCDEKKRDMKKKEEEWKDGECFNWIDEKFKRDVECPMKSKGKAKNCKARDLCFPNGYRKKK